MKINVVRSIGRIALAVLVIAGAVAQPLRAENFPDPKDEAKLYDTAKKEGKLVWYSSAPLEAANAIAHEFTATYPGVAVEVQRILGPAQYRRFVQETEAKQYIVDVLGSTEQPNMADLVRLGDIAAWKIPTYDRFTPDLRIDSSVYAPFVTDNALVYNVNKVSAEELKLLSDWKGVLDPRFKGRFAVTDAKCSACYSAVHMFLDPKMRDRYGPDFLKGLAAQKPAVYSDIVTLVDRVVAGENDFAIWPWSGIAFIKWQQGAPIRWIFPKPAPLFGGGWQGISAFAPHPYAARLFQNWMLGEAGALVLQLKYGVPTSLSGFPDQRPLTRETWYRSPDADKYPIDWDRWAQNYDKDMDLWAKTLREGR